MLSAQLPAQTPQNSRITVTTSALLQKPEISGGADGGQATESPGLSRRVRRRLWTREGRPGSNPSPQASVFLPQPQAGRAVLVGVVSQVQRPEATWEDGTPWRQEALEPGREAGPGLWSPQTSRHGAAPSGQGPNAQTQSSRRWKGAAGLELEGLPGSWMTCGAWQASRAVEAISKIRGSWGAFHP